METLKLPLPPEMVWPNVMTRKQVAAYLQCSTATVYRLTRCGELPATHIGRLVRYKRADLEAFIEGRNDRGSDPEAREG